MISHLIGHFRHGIFALHIFILHPSIIWVGGIDRMDVRNNVLPLSVLILLTSDISRSPSIMCYSILPFLLLQPSSPRRALYISARPLGLALPPTPAIAFISLCAWHSPASTSNMSSYLVSALLPVCVYHFALRAWRRAGGTPSYDP